MKNITLLFAALIMSFIGVKAQILTGEKAATHFYIVNLDQNLLDIFNPENDEHFSKVSIKNEMVSSIIDTVYSISSQIFKNELGLELLPLNELQNKIKYNSDFPNCPDMVNIKKVLKTASGYKYYVDYFINIFSGIDTDLPVKPSLTKIKPMFAISFTLYDGTGKVIKKVDSSYDSKKPLAENRKEANKTEQEVKAKLCNLCTNALTEFVVEYRKKLVAQM